MSHHLLRIFTLNTCSFSLSQSTSLSFVLASLQLLFKLERKQMEPWEELDIDASDIESYVRRCNSTTNVIPGPAGNVEAVLGNRISSQPLPTQEFLNRIYEESHNRDFSTKEWQWAQKFIEFHGTSIQPSSCHANTLTKLFDCT